MRRDKDGRTLEFCLNADGGALLVQDDEPTRQSVYLTRREMRWLLFATPVAMLRSLWVRDGGAYDLLHRRCPE